MVYLIRGDIMSIMKYCPRCGNIISGSANQCNFCNHEIIETKYTFDEYLNIGRHDFEEKIMRIYGLRGSTEFSEKLYNKRHEEEDKNLHGEGSYVAPKPNAVTCPYCQSTYVSKIGTLNRIASVGLFGLASKKIGKQWHCNHCKSDF